MSKVIRASFDSVHDPQRIFREMVDAFSRPGTQVDLSDECKGIRPPASFSKILTGLAVTLLDQEVTFHIEGEETNKVNDYLQRETFSEPAKVDEADYQFVSSMKAKQIEGFMQQMKTGTLYQPHRSATVFLRVENFLQSDRSSRYHLSGPGIKETSTLTVQGLDEKWMDVRNTLTAEYPLGVDVGLVSEDGRFVALPRSIKVERG